ncbi:MAG: hypothetical protein M3025_07555, partial [Actinomycetota bacterium]|nr:hypothetical protein [Actinomycetota bacterium]
MRDIERGGLDELREHIVFAQEPVRGFAEAQLGTLSELEIEMGPGWFWVIITFRSTRSAPTRPAAAIRC